jgi:hypothetical protein
MATLFDAGDDVALSPPASLRPRPFYLLPYCTCIYICLRRRRRRRRPVRLDASRRLFFLDATRRVVVLRRRRRHT